MKIGFLREPDGENRASAIPETIKLAKGLGLDVCVEKGIGERAFYTDKEYEAEGATICDRNGVLAMDMVVGINQPSENDIKGMKENTVMLSIFNPMGNKEYVSQLQAANLTTFSLDNIPRTTRAQSMDVLSSMATVAGYKSVLIAANHLPNFFPMFMTAAGTITPAKVLIIGAGVAGLQAISTARRLGSVVHAFDVRAAAKEEVLSLGAKFVDVEGSTDDTSAGGYAVEQTKEYKKKQQEAIDTHAAKSDIIITTAQIPGRKAPMLVGKATVEQMKPGSVIVDLAASTGGNCEVSENNKTIVHNGVTVIGNSNIPSLLPKDASKMFGKNIINLLKILTKDGNLNLDFEDDIIVGTCVTHNKEIISERIKKAYNN